MEWGLLGLYGGRLTTVNFPPVCPKINPRPITVPNEPRDITARCACACMCVCVCVCMCVCVCACLCVAFD